MRTVREAAEAAVLQPHWVKQFGKRFLQDLVTDVAAEMAADRESVREACAKEADGIGCNSCAGLNDGAETVRGVDIKGKPVASRSARASSSRASRSRRSPAWRTSTPTRPSTRQEKASTRPTGSIGSSARVAGLTQKEGGAPMASAEDEIRYWRERCRVVENRLGRMASIACRGLVSPVAWRVTESDGEPKVVTPIGWICWECHQKQDAAGACQNPRCVPGEVARAFVAGAELVERLNG